MSDSHVKGRTYGGAYILYRCTQVHTHPYTHGCTVLSPDTHTHRDGTGPYTHIDSWFSPPHTRLCGIHHHKHTDAENHIICTHRCLTKHPIQKELSKTHRAVFPVSLHLYALLSLWWLPFQASCGHAVGTVFCLVRALLFLFVC